MPDCHRRAFLAGSLAAVLAPGAAKASPGVPAPILLWEAVSSLDAVRDGGGDARRDRIAVLVSPGCDYASLMWRESRALAAGAGLKWIPVAGRPDAEDEVSVLASVLEGGEPRHVRSMLLGDELPASGPVGLALATRQAQAYDLRIGRLLWEATGRAPAMPTTVYLARGGRVRVARGAIDAALFAEIASAV